MTWRGSTTNKDRLYSCLVYLVPLLEALPLGFSLMSYFPILATLLSPLILLSGLYFFEIAGFQLIALAIFIGLYTGVVRNESLRHFLRFNTMQALLLAIIIYIVRLLMQLLGIASSLGSPVALDRSLSPLFILATALFLAIYGASIYSIFRSIKGQYAEMPIVSEAAYTQTR